MENRCQSRGVEPRVSMAAPHVTLAKIRFPKKKPKLSEIGDVIGEGLPYLFQSVASIL